MVVLRSTFNIQEMVIVQRHLLAKLSKLRFFILLTIFIYINITPTALEIQLRGLQLVTNLERTEQARCSHGPSCEAPSLQRAIDSPVDPC